ncbi:MAG: hypothetical protein F7B60_03545 [Desulfurococcales archaeon]|nr:hypothetical protein [Desulfurococcales archaeon]
MNFKTFILGLLLVALVASIYSAPKSLFINIAFEGTPSPYNTNWLGTSDLYNLLTRENYTVYSPTTWGQLLESINKSETNNVILVFISPDYPISTNEATELFGSIRNRNVSLLVGDENITSNQLLSPLGIKVTGNLLKGPDGSPYDPAVLNVPSIYTFSWKENSIQKFTLMLSIASNISLNKYYKNAILSVDYKGRLIGVFIPSNTGSEYRSIAVFGDGTIFLNTALRSSTREMNYTRFALIVFKALSHGDDPKNVTVIIDSSHYHKYIPQIPQNANTTEATESYLKVPLPIMLHPAMLTYFFLVLEKGAEREFLSYLAKMPLLSVPIVGLASYLAYRLLKMGFPYESVDDDKDYTISEVTVLTQSRYRQTIVSAKKLSKDEIRKALYNLNFILDEVFKEHFGITLKEISQDPPKAEAVGRILNLSPVYLLDFSRWMVSYRDKYEGKRRFTPLVLRWSKTLENRAREAEFILEKLGYTLESSKKGFKGVEYGVRKY